MSAPLIPLFWLTALLYAAVGFGGGSTYNALLVLSGADYRLLPTIALACNIIVVSGGVWRFSRAGLLPARRLLPFLITSIPAAWIGGRVAVSELVFVGLLGLTLVLSGLRLLTLPSRAPVENADLAPPVTPTALALLIGAAIGFLAGLVGIGGGIFLAPILYLLAWGTAQQIAAACSLFILTNSLAGLVGQMSKLNDLALLSDALAYWPLWIAVLIGGQIGSWLAAGQLQALWMRRLTALLILYVALRLLWRFGALVQI